MTRVNAGPGRLGGHGQRADRPGRWSYRVEGWSDPYGTWHHDAVIKIGADVDTELMLEEGARVLERAVAEVDAHRRAGGGAEDAIGKLRDTAHPRRKPAGRRGSPGGRGASSPARPLRDYVSAEPGLPVAGRAGPGAVRRLVRVLPPLRGRRARRDHRPVDQRAPSPPRPSGCPPSPAMGFDVIYLTPDPPDRPDQPQGPQQHPARRRARPRIAVRDRLGRRRPRRHPPRPRHVRRLRRVRRPRPAELGLEVALDLALQCAPDHPWVDHPPGVVHHPRRRHDRVRGEPAEEVPGHLPAELRQRPGGHLRGDPPGRAGLDRPRRHDLPGRQPAHQAGGVLGVADRRRRRRPPGDHLAGRGVHPARR